MSTILALCNMFSAFDGKDKKVVRWAADSADSGVVGASENEENRKESMLENRQNKIKSDKRKRRKKVCWGESARKSIYSLPNEYVLTCQWV